MGDYDNTQEILDLIKAMWGLKDAPRAFSFKLHPVTLKLGLRPSSYDQEFEIKEHLLTAKHVDDINMGGKECDIDKPNHLSQGFRVGKMAKHHKCLKQLEALIAYLSNRSHVAQPHTAQTLGRHFFQK